MTARSRAQGSGVLRSHLPVSLCRAHVDGPGIPPNDSENHTQYAFPCPRAFVGLVTTACVFIAYGLGQLLLARTFKVFFVYKKTSIHNFARGYDWNLLFATCIVTRVTLLLGAFSLSFVWPT